MDNFKIIYRILRCFEKAMDCEEFEIEQISAERLKVSEQRWSAIMEMLAKEGYIDGISVQRSIDGQILLSVSNPRITLHGLEYLQENSLMQKAAKLAKGVVEVVK